MYSIYADGELLYNANLSNDGYGVIDPKITKEVNKAGSCEFTLPPDHPFYDRLKKLKTIVRVLQDGVQIFRGRVLSEETDFYKRKTIYCEGELAFLNDSVVRPYTLQGTAYDLFNQLIRDHNNAVDAYQRLRPGICDVTGEVDVKQKDHESTWAALESMIKSFGGYLSTRVENGVRYVDYRNSGCGSSGQTVEFGVNLLDLSKHITAEDIYTVLIPLGKLNNSARLTIESVNDGVDYIQDDAAVNMFGRIWKTEAWDDVTDADKLKQKGMEQLQKGIAEAVEITVNAVDLHMVNVDTDRIDIGYTVRVVSAPHGLDDEFMCSKIVLDLANLDKNTYTFGQPKDTATGKMATAEKLGGAVGGGKSKQEELEDDVWKMGTEFEKDREHIRLLAWSQFTQGTMTENRQSVLNLTDDEILAQVSRIDVDSVDGIVNQIKSSLEQTAAGFTSRVEKNGVISAINQTAESITIQASKINLSGYVTASQLSAVEAEITNLTTGSTTASVLKANQFVAGGHSVGFIKIKADATVSGMACRVLGYVE